MRSCASRLVGLGDFDRQQEHQGCGFAGDGCRVRWFEDNELPPLEMLNDICVSGSHYYMASGWTGPVVGMRPPPKPRLSVPWLLLRVHPMILLKCMMAAVTGTVSTVVDQP
jgi:hypothetical protein